MGEGSCPLKLKKMAHMHKNGKQIVACKIRTARMLIAAGGHTVVYGTGGGGIKIKRNQSDFHYSQKNSSFGNLYSNVDFLIITKNSGGLAAMQQVEPICTYLIKSRKYQPYVYFDEQKTLCQGSDAYCLSL